MKHQLSYTLGLILLGIIGAGVSPADADTIAAGPYYATPSWDQKLACDSSANCPRFIVLSNWSNDAVLDRETGLVWQRSPSTTAHQWPQAHTFCRAAPTGGRFGWRLPTINELFSLRDPGAVAAPFLPAGHPFTVQPLDYWSANTSSANTLNAWYMKLGTNAAPLVESKGEQKLGWCVRGGQSTDPQ